MSAYKKYYYHIKFHLILLFFFLPFNANAAPKIKKDNLKFDDIFNLSCKNIENQECISRALGISACSWIYEINYGKDADEAFKISNSLLIKTLKNKNLNLDKIFEKDGSINNQIKVFASKRIGLCKEETKIAIPKLMKNIDKKTKLNNSQIENLAATFPSYYLGLFKQKFKTK